MHVERRPSRVNYATVGGSATARHRLRSARTGTLDLSRPGTVTVVTIVVPTIADDHGRAQRELHRAALQPRRTRRLGMPPAFGTHRQRRRTGDPLRCAINSIVGSPKTVAPARRWPVFTVSLSNASAQARCWSVVSAPSTGTATTPSDYTRAPPGRLTFAGGAIDADDPGADCARHRSAEPDEDLHRRSCPPRSTSRHRRRRRARRRSVDDDIARAADDHDVRRGRRRADDVNEDGATLHRRRRPAVGRVRGVRRRPAASGCASPASPSPPASTVAAARLELTARRARQWLAMRRSSVAAEASAGQRPVQRRVPAVVATADLPRSAGCRTRGDVQWLADTRYPLNDVRALVQATPRSTEPAWSAGRALSLVARGTGAAFARKFIKSADGGAADAPRRWSSTYAAPAPPNLPPLIPAATAGAGQRHGAARRRLQCGGHRSRRRAADLRLDLRRRHDRHRPDSDAPLRDARRGPAPPWRCRMARTS